VRYERARFSERRPSRASGTGTASPRCTVEDGGRCASGGLAGDPGVTVCRLKSFPIPANSHKTITVDPVPANSWARFASVT